MKRRENRLEDIRYDLIMMAEREAMKLWRLARRAKKHGASEELVQSIREEGSLMYNTMTSYPERLITWQAVGGYEFKYAFKY